MRGTRSPGARLVIALLALSWCLPALADDADSESPFAHLELRNIGPVNMSGRVTDVEGIAGDPNVVYVGAASGGVWKTTNGGLTFAPIFDDQPIASIGDIALAPSNPDVVYVGSGEANPRNSVSFGDGVYKSTDGGRSWRHVGLADSRHVSKILVHPTDPDRVFVAALGHIFGRNEERGVFRSTDGGDSWEKVLYLDDRHGASDLAMDPSNPNILFAGLWHFDRKPWTHTTGSEEGGLWRSVDGGDSWERIAEGLPKLIGRLGVEVSRSDPDVVYVIAETHEGTVFRSTDRGKTFAQVNDTKEVVSRGLYYTHIRVDPADENRVYSVSSRLWLSIDGGKSFDQISRSTHVDFHALWIDPTDPDRVWQGQDGGVAVSYDRGVTWEPIRNLPLAQFYQIYADDRLPFYYLGGGLQDNGTWYGPSRNKDLFGVLEDDWRMMSFGDAYWVVPHPDDPEIFLSESQAGGILRTDMNTGRQVDVSPQPRRNDGGPVGELDYRFNWNAPIVQSPHDPYTVYFCGNVVFKTSDFGDSWEVISPDLTTDDPEKQGEAGGPAFVENTTAEYHTTLISCAESAARAGVLWAGSDDGLVHVSRDGGGGWTNVTGNLPRLPESSPVSHIEPSRLDAGTAWATFDRHMFDDFQPYVYETTDFGATWTRLPSDGMPETAWIWVLRQDPRDADLLWAGTELGLYASRDRGRHWEKAHFGNFPVVAVHDLLIHPRQNDLILGTHGRALWILDDLTPYQAWSEEIGGSAAHLFPVRPAIRFPRKFTRYGLGDKEHRAENPPGGALITYYLAEDLTPDAAAGETGTASAKGAEPTEETEPAPPGDDGAENDKEPRLKLEILDGGGEVIRTLDDLPLKKGVQRVAWDLAADAPFQRREARGGFIFFDGPRGPAVLPGTYTARLTLDGETWETPVEVGVDPTVDVSAADLEAAHAMASAAAEMEGAANHALRALDALSAQASARREAAKLMEVELSPELERDWKAFDEAVEERLHALAREDGKPFWSQGPRIVERIGDLGAVDGQFAAPTAAQHLLYDQLRSELAAELGVFNEFLTTTVPVFNGKLGEAGLPPLAVPATVEAP